MLSCVVRSHERTQIRSAWVLAQPLQGKAVHLPSSDKYCQHCYDAVRPAVHMETKQQRVNRPDEALQSMQQWKRQKQLRSVIAEATQRVPPNKCGQTFLSKCVKQARTKSFVENTWGRAIQAHEDAASALASGCRPFSMATDPSSKIMSPSAAHPCLICIISHSKILSLPHSCRQTLSVPSSFQRAPSPFLFISFSA